MRIALALSLFCLSATALAQESPTLQAQGEAFLVSNATKEGVVVTESGLQYKILKPGSDEKPTKRSKVTVHYQGKHINGAVFDSTFEGDPSTFRMRQVIKGWIEGLQYVGVGGHIVLYVPPELAYGRRGSPPLIGKHETLVFIIALLEIH